MNEEIHQMAYTQDADSNKFILFRNDGSKDVEVQSFDSEEELLDILVGVSKLEAITTPTK